MQFGGIGSLVNVADVKERVILVASGVAANVAVSIDGSDEFPGLATDVADKSADKHADDDSAENHAADDIGAATGLIDGGLGQVHIELDVVQVVLVRTRKFRVIEIFGDGGHIFYPKVKLTT